MDMKDVSIREAEEPLFRFHVTTRGGRLFNVICTQWPHPDTLCSDDLFTKKQCELMEEEIRKIEQEKPILMSPKDVRRRAMVAIRYNNL